ncbi:MAG: MMPL family transporter, partial [Planctomycetaceae bacterium]|nr:MMPL family transporter [Planctomycetaceae bacterium]
RRLPTPFQGTLLRRMTSRRPLATTVITTLVLLGIGACGLSWEHGRFAPRAKYDANLLNLQADDVDSVIVQNRVFREARGSLLYAVSQAAGPEELLKRRAAFESLPSVSRVEELASHLPPHDRGHTRLVINAIASRLSHLSDFPREFPQLNPQSIGVALEDLLSKLQEIEALSAQESVTALDEFLDRLQSYSLEDQIRLLDGYQYAMLAALKAQFAAVAAIADPVPVNARDFPEAIRDRFVSDDGTWLMRIYPQDQIWDEEPLSRFVSELRTVDPEVTGTPLQNFEAARQIRESYLRAAVFAVAVIWLVLLVDTVDKRPLLIGLTAPLAVVAFALVAIPRPHELLTPVQAIGLYIALTTTATAIFDFTNVRNTFLAFLPPIGGFVIMFGVLGLCGIDLNPANLIVLPLILGIGVDDGVHVLHDFRSQKRRYRTSPSTINAITLTSLTSMVGFGSMLVADHRGLVSLGLVLVIGVGSCLFVSLVMLPSVLHLISRNSRKRRAPRNGNAPPDSLPLERPQFPAIAASRDAAA